MIRLAAWASVPQREGKSLVRVETHADCSRCLSGCAQSWHTDYQRSQRCPFISRRKWAAPGGHLAAYMGAPGTDEVEAPLEDNTDGCPGAWYRTEFFASLRPYLRREADGVYSANPLLDRCDDPLVLAAVAYYELESSMHRAWCFDIERNL